MANIATTPQAPNTASNNTWPGAFGIFKISLAAVAFNIWVYLAINIMSLIVQILPTALDNVTSLSDGTIQVLTALTYVPAIIFGLMSTIVLLRALDEEKLSIGDSFNKLTVGMVLRYLGISIVTGVIAVVSFLLLIVPFFFVVPRILLAQYYVVDQKMGVFDSLKASWAQTKGHVGKVYGVIGASIVMFLPVLTIIGIPVAIFLIVAYAAAFPILYRFVIGKDPIKPTATA